MRKNYVLSGLMGLCVGDALGVPVEFKSREELGKNPVKGITGYGTHDQPPGTWSDDSSLTFCLAESLCKGYNLDDIASKFCKWLNEAYWTPHGKVFDVGITTRNAIKRLCKGNEPVTAGGDDETDNGNGSLMRILPVAFLTKDMAFEDTLRIVEEVSSLTHRHKRSIIACTAYTIIANELIKGAGKEEAFKKLRLDILFLFDKKKEEYHKELRFFKRLLHKDFFKSPVKEIRSTGYVIDGLEAAFWCFMNNDTYKNVVLSAVNLGGDTDTIAATAGGLAGLYYGYENIPQEWVDKIARKDDIIKLAERLEKALKKKKSGG